MDEEEGWMSVPLTMPILPHIIEYTFNGANNEAKVKAHQSDCPHRLLAARSAVFRISTPDLSRALRLRDILRLPRNYHADPKHMLYGYQLSPDIEYASGRVRRTYSHKIECLA